MIDCEQCKEHTQTLHVNPEDDCITYHRQHIWNEQYNSLNRFKRVEAQMERITTILKCPAEDVLRKLNKHLKNIADLEAELSTKREKPKDA